LGVLEQGLLTKPIPRDENVQSLITCVDLFATAASDDVEILGLLGLLKHNFPLWEGEENHLLYNNVSAFLGQVLEKSVFL
jgi:hypothetical protein